MKKRTITLTVDGPQYDLVRQKFGHIASRLLRIALRTAADVEDEQDLELQVQIATVNDRVKYIQERLQEIKRLRDEINDEEKLLRNEMQRLRQKESQIKLQLRLIRLERAMKQLQRLIKVYDYNVDEVLADDDGRKLVEEMKEMRPDFDLQKFVERMKLVENTEVKYGGG